MSGASARAGALFRGTSSSCSEPRTVRGQLLLSLGEELRERSKQVPRSSSAVRVSSDEDTQRAIDRTRLAERGERLNGLDVDAEAECRSRIDPSRSPARRFDCVPRSESESPASSREIPRAPFVPRWRALRSTKDPAPGCFRPASRTTMRRLVRHENEAPVADEAHGREGGAEQRSGIGHDDTGRVLFPNNQPGNDDLYSL